MWGQIAFSSLFIGGLSLWFLLSPMVQGVLTPHGEIYTMTAFFAFFMFINIFNTFNSRTHDINLISYLSLNKPFIYIMGLVIIVQVLFIFFGGSVFRTEMLGFHHFIIVTMLALTVLPADMLRKLYIRLRHGTRIVNT
jgi:magnesium-transporting ATPase (P-type)